MLDKYAADKIEYAINRYKMETQRLLDVLDKQLEGKQWLLGDDYTIADMAWFPWVRCIDTGYSAKEVVGVDNYKNVSAWLARCVARPASVKGLTINSSTGDNKEYHSED